MNKKLITILFLLTVVTLAGCGSWASWYVEDGVLTDTIYSVELRKSGGVIMWMTHDETGAYCVLPEQANRKKLEAMMFSRDEVVVEYRESRLIHGAKNCWGSESSHEGSGFETFVVTNIRYLSEVR